MVPGPLLFFKRLLRETLMSRGRATGMFTRVSLAGSSLACHCNLSGINLKQWSHYNDVAEAQGVIHIRQPLISTGPFDLFPRCAFEVEGLDFSCVAVLSIVVTCDQASLYFPAAKKK